MSQFVFRFANRLGRCLLAAGLAAAVHGCIAGGVSEVDADPAFNWDALKRDQILMTPLLDLRVEPKAPAGHAKDLRFVSKDRRIAYPETFKQTFRELRKDIRVFGAGGAFEHMAGLKGLDELGRAVIAKTPLGAADLARIKEGSQDIRFIFFFAVTDERLSYDFHYTFRSDQPADVKTYSSDRRFTVKLALWDSLENKTVWIGTEHLVTSENNRVEVSNPTKKLEKRKDKRIVWIGVPEDTNLEIELAKHPGRFPDFPGREPALSGSFDDFALALPLNPSEAKLIEYEHFTYHRPEVGVRVSQVGTAWSSALQLGSSSVIHYRLRFGAAALLPLSSAAVEEDGETSTVTSSSYGLTFDYEWQLQDELRLLTGLMTGVSVFSLVGEDDESGESDESGASGEDEGAASTVDAARFVWPRAFLLFGAKGGVQYGVGASGRLYDGLEEELLKRHRPSPWSLDLALGYAFRGF